MKLPRYVYVVVIYNRIPFFPEAVYVGSSADVEKRIKEHLHDYCSGTQYQFHELMRHRRFQTYIVDEIHNGKDAHLEYDWMDFFQRKTRLNLFNVRRYESKADWRRILPDRWQAACAYIGIEAKVDGR